MSNICFFDKKEISGTPIRTTPCRHFISPNGFNHGARNPEEHSYIYFCSPEHEKLQQQIIYVAHAILDRNASDADCFQHESWGTRGLIKTPIRIGKCKITGKEVKVEPMQPGDNSGQPKECYDHFRLNPKYQAQLEDFLAKGYISKYWCEKLNYGS